MKKGIFILLVACCLQGFAQQADSSAPALTLSGYAELYYLYDSGNPSDHLRPSFVYSHNRHNELTLNLGFVKAAYSRGSLRGSLALMAGTYANANLAAEPGVLKNVLEASVGFRLSPKREWWLDAGIFPSHIGFESAIGKDCPTLTRSILADNSPYYESGAKFSSTSKKGKWFFSLLLLNGWQRIQRVDGNQTPAFGHQLTWKPSGRLTFNSSSFVGNDKPDSLRQMRYFHNFYGLLQLSERLSLTAGFDIGAEQKARGSSDYALWYTPVLIARYQSQGPLAFALRGEYYSDPSEVIIATGTPNGFQTWGGSATLDCRVGDAGLWRIEARGFWSQDAIFMQEGAPSRQNLSLATSFSITLQ